MKKIILIAIIFLTFGFEQIFAQSVFYGISAGVTSVTGPEAFTNDISSGGSGFSSRQPALPAPA